jgi:hypothetical protein
VHTSGHLWRRGGWERVGDGTHRRMTRVLVALFPQMYREAIAHSIRSNRPGLEVRIATPEAAESEIDDFRPHLLVHNDTAPIAEGALAGVPCRVEVLYSDGLDARVSADGSSVRIDDASTGDLLELVDRAAAMANEAPPV